ncbi:hypothetical protein SAMN00120144_0965 [Hymenobacter roseosalivarius DSM 11622]|uniref:Uncharacterized protein n=1 Tax=Hymenobacter roseosalivarius DSM 11622 TaxID=645990 RepID=A0A1W1V8H9_9BACT|nr:hypothetical protein [Hymenobacter roseosalivarius]SMB89668.1 hypothetical protein SAMN00120144_0965 [Hymenobacter roseosalivarius DSM 11622]
MKKLNVIAAVIFGMLALLNLWLGDWVQTSICLLLSIGFLLSDLQYAPTGQDVATPSSLSPGRKYLSITIIVAALALMGYQIGRDSKAKQQREAQTEAR